MDEEDKHREMGSLPLLPEDSFLLLFPATQSDGVRRMGSGVYLRCGILFQLFLFDFLIIRGHFWALGDRFIFIMLPYEFLLLLHLGLVREEDANKDARTCMHTPRRRRVVRDRALL